MINFSTPLEGLSRAAARVDTTARTVASAGVPTAADAPADVVDLSAEMVALLQAKNDFAANASVIRAQEDLTQSLLNILA